MTIMAAMMEFDVPVDRVYLDPLLLPVGVAQQQALEAAEAIAMFGHLNEPPLKTTVGLSNIYNGCPEHVKSPMAAALLALLIPAGLSSAIMDPNDELQMQVARTDPAELAAERCTREVDVGSQERDPVLPLVPRLGSDTRDRAHLQLRDGSRGEVDLTLLEPVLADVTPTTPGRSSRFSSRRRRSTASCPQTYCARSPSSARRRSRGLRRRDVLRAVPPQPRGQDDRQDLHRHRLSRRRRAGGHPRHHRRAGPRGRGDL